MILSSKYPGRCVVCGDEYPIGTRIEWTAQEGARHITCTPPPTVRDEAIPEYVLTDQDPVFKIARENQAKVNKCSS